MGCAADAPCATGATAAGTRAGAPTALSWAWAFTLDEKCLNLDEEIQRLTALRKLSTTLPAQTTPPPKCLTLWVPPISTCLRYWEKFAVSCRT